MHRTMHNVLAHNRSMANQKRTKEREEGEEEKEEKEH